MDFTEIVLLCIAGVALILELVAMVGRRLGWTVPRPKPVFGHAAEALLGLPEGGRVRLVGSYHVSPHNTSTRRLTEEMLDAALRRL